VKSEVISKESLHKLSSDLLSNGISVRIAASGYSMFPAIRPGDVVEISPVEDRDKLIPGTIVAIERDSDFLVHRFTGFADNEEHSDSVEAAGWVGADRLIITRGDSNSIFDQPVGMESLAGRVTMIIRGKKTIINPLSVTQIPYFRNRLAAIIYDLMKRVATSLRRAGRAGSASGSR
jgi:hypothetical protein